MGENLSRGVVCEICVRFSAGCMKIVSLGANSVWGVMFCISVG